MNEFLTCDEIKDLLSPLFDMELCAKDRGIVETHIENCPECRQKLENIQQLSSFIKTSYQTDNENSPDEIFVFNELLPEEINMCLNVKSNLSAFIDGELERESTAEILEHVISCEFCRKQYEKIKKTRELTRTYLENSYSNGFYKPKRKIYISIMEKLREEKNRKKILTSAAALIFVTVLSWFSVYQFNSVKHNNNLNINNTRFIRIDRPMYVNSEDYVLSELNSTPQKGIIALLYDN